jgi:hypothetical protein
MKTKRLSKRLGVAAFAAACACSGAAHAALSPTGVSCSQSTSLSSATGYLACAGAFSGNDRNQAADVAAEIAADWGLAVTDVTDITGSAAHHGSGSLSFAEQTGRFVIALKAGDAFSLYEFDASAADPIDTIAFDTRGVGFYSSDHQHPHEHDGQGLSHADLFSVAAAVPEPSAAWLLLAGLVVLAGRASRASRRS